MRNDALVHKIIDKAVLPQLRQRFHDTVGVVVDYSTKSRTATIRMYNPYSGGYIWVYDVPVDEGGVTSHLNRDPKPMDIVKVGFMTGNMNMPVIRKIMPQMDISEETTVVIPRVIGVL